MQKTFDVTSEFTENTGVSYFASNQERDSWKQQRSLLAYDEKMFNRRIRKYLSLVVKSLSPWDIIVDDVSLESPKEVIFRNLDCEHS